MEQGYDAYFVGDVADYLKCMICQLVVREPVLLVECGHRFCKMCFEDVKQHADLENIDLLCPTDRMNVDLSKVFEDKSISRAVMDLRVKCDHFLDGCQWTGELRNLELHLDGGCSCTEKERTFGLLHHLEGRIESCENHLEQKDKELILLQAQFYEKDEEINGLKDEVKRIETRLTKRVSLLEFQLYKTPHEPSMKAHFFQKDDEVIALKDQLTRTADDLSDRISVIENKMTKNTNNATTTTTNNNNNDNNNGISLTTDLDESLGTLSIKEKSKSNYINQTMKQKLQTESESQPPASVFQEESYSKEKFEKMSERIRMLQEHVTNTVQLSKKQTVFTWKVEHYNYHKSSVKVDTKIYSPRFYSCVNGHCFRLSAKWLGLTKSRLCIGIHFCHDDNGKYKNEVFKMGVKFQAFDKHGYNERIEIITEVDMETYQEAVEFKPGKDIAERGWGHNDFLTMPSLEDYIVNDCLSINCILFTF